MTKIQVQKSNPRGRPRLGSAVMLKRMVSVDQATVDAALKLGAGSFSRGVREAVRQATEAAKVEL